MLNGRILNKYPGLTGNKRGFGLFEQNRVCVFRNNSVRSPFVFQSQNIAVIIGSSAVHNTFFSVLRDKRFRKITRVAVRPERYNLFQIPGRARNGIGFLIFAGDSQTHFFKRFNIVDQFIVFTVGKFGFRFFLVIGISACFHPVFAHQNTEFIRIYYRRNTYYVVIVGSQIIKRRALYHIV